MDITVAMAVGKTALDVAKGMVTLTKDVAIAQKAIELQQLILQLQEQVRDAGLENDALIRQVRDLQEALVRKEDLSRYRLVALETGAQVYEIDPAKMKDGEIPHYICPNCLSDGKKSILQSTLLRDRRLTCVACRSGYAKILTPGATAATTGVDGNDSWMAR